MREVPASPAACRGMNFRQNRLTECAARSFLPLSYLSLPFVIPALFRHSRSLSSFPSSRESMTSNRCRIDVDSRRGRRPKLVLYCFSGRRVDMGARLRGRDREERA